MKKSSTRGTKVATGIALILALVWQHIEAVKLGYEVEKSRRQVSVLKAKVAARELELDKDLAPTELASRARARLGMVPAIPESLRILGQNQESGERQGWVSRLLSRNFAI